MQNQPQTQPAPPTATRTRPPPAIKIKPTQQRLLGLDVVRLKSLQDVSLDFSHSALTAIMGSNCTGKTTVLHALACSFNPPDSSSPDYYFPKFFRPNTDALWQGSDFTIRYKHRLGKHEFSDLKLQYTKVNDRWSPRYIKRPERYTRFISIGESVPDMEVLNLNQMVHYQKVEHNDDTGILVREVAGQVLNRVYETLYRVTYAYRGKLSIGVKTPTVTYSGLSMSSGEQRVFRVLDAVFRAPDYGLILIDEIDLFLHQDALQRLLGKLHEHCEAKHKQLIFTTHFPPVADMYDKMCIYTLNRVPSKTVIWRGYSYEAMRHITGTQQKPIQCYVEDDVAELIVMCIGEELGISRFIQVGKYGPADNAFSVAADLQLSGVNVESMVAILDGDVYGNWKVGEKCRKERIKKAIVGTGSGHLAQRKKLIRLVRSFKPVVAENGEMKSPEQVLHAMLHAIDPQFIPQNRKVLHDLALGVQNVTDRHGFVNKIIEFTGERRDIALSKLIELAALAPAWSAYTKPVRHWLTKKKAALAL
jgi:ABC-type lipoprotein export system ATPase subunit